VSRAPAYAIDMQVALLLLIICALLVSVAVLGGLWLSERGKRIDCEEELLTGRWGHADSLSAQLLQLQIKQGLLPIMPVYIFDISELEGKP